MIEEVFSINLLETNRCTTNFKVKTGKRRRKTLIVLAEFPSNEQKHSQRKPEETNKGKSSQQKLLNKKKMKTTKQVRRMKHI